jgi:putative alpha-1,2-mannosidase
MLRSLVAMGIERGGYLPAFPCWNAATGAMIGDHVAVIIADGLLKGVLNATQDSEVFARRALDLVLKNALEPNETIDARPGLESYAMRGFIPKEDDVLRPGRHSQEQVSRTIEYAFDDAVASDLARRVGQGASASANAVKSASATLAGRARNYQNLWDPASGYLRLKKFNGKFGAHHHLDPSRKYPWLCEGTPAHWLFAAAPHDPYGLAELVGGARVLESRLDEFFGLRYVARARQQYVAHIE